MNFFSRFFQKKFLFFFCAFFVFSIFNVHSQTEQENVRVTTGTIAPAPKQKPEFPQWALDLRRFDIIMFGSFPFTYWFASTGMDLYRSSQHNWDTRYAPWPVKSAGAINMTTDEYKITLAFAIGGSILAALADHIIVRVKRNRAAREAARLAPGDAIITRTPRTAEPEGGEGGGEAGAEGESGADGGAPETAPAEAP
ncbi:MAG: hypothetical protein LBI91_02870 [Spirochaetaceae bacterium]|jgi:hypothetical protein|nr:hypothetical protein [Spirochaetaceae bacterium]